MPVIQLRGQRHYFRLDGAEGKPPLVLLHPIGADHSLFDKLVPTLLAGFQVLRYDLRGHGGTDIPATDCTIGDLSEDWLELTAALGWHGFAACGVSLGGMVALHAAAEAPHRLIHLTLCSTAAAMTPPPGGWDQRAATARQQGIGALAAGMVERMVSQRHRVLDDPAVDSLKAVFLHTDAEGYARSIAVLRDADLRPLLDRVRAPTLIVRGADDPLITQEKMDVLLGGIKGSLGMSFPCGHFPPLEWADGFALGLLRTVPATVGSS